MSPSLLGHAGGSWDEGLTTLLLIAAGILGWIGISRLRGREFLRVPRPAAWLLVVLAVASVAGAVALPGLVKPKIASLRPTTKAVVKIVEPQAGETFTGDPAIVPIRIDLEGASLASASSTSVTPDQGHIHVSLDGLLISMTQQEEGMIDVAPGRHTIVVDFVAGDHGPFNPPVLDRVSFLVEG